ncbi:MAG: sugar phosphate isomerase/epimerase [Ktedonobacteraceae bacterium]|nr:sugar phosphate isomerase/epimerase [Ktedonobacteraceae bacterium]
MANQLVGLQLYTVRDQTAQDFKRTLQSVGEIGYDGVEFAGYGGISSKEMAACLADFNLRALGAHVGLPALEADIERELNYCLDIGCTHLIIPSLERKWCSAEGFRAIAPRLNEVGRRCQERGITLCYHNHDFEFAREDGKYLLDILLDATDAALVRLELDVYWAAYAGADPVAYLRRHAERVSFIHVKDMTASRTFTEVGDGILDIAGYCAAAAESGTRFLIVENDLPQIPSLESARRSHENLRRILKQA